MHDDVRVMSKGAKDGILAFVYSIRLTKTLRIKKIQAQLDYLSFATLFNLKLIFIIYTDDTHEYGMHVILQDVVIVYQYIHNLCSSPIWSGNICIILYTSTCIKRRLSERYFFPDDSMYHHNSLIIIIVQGIISL